MRRPVLPITLATTLLLVSFGCNELPDKSAPASSTTPAASASAESDVLATVNGVPIRVSDLHYVLARERGGKDKEVDEKRAKAALEKIIDQELARQKAEAAGLDRDPEYLRKLHFMEAPVHDFARTELTDAFFRAEADKTKITVPEAKKHFEDNKERYQTELHVWQILVRNDEERIRKLKAELDAGTPFEEVAATLFPPSATTGQRPPWDIGFLRWHQIPSQWSEPLAGMKAGDVSGVVQGPKGRTWILKLVEQRRNEAITFEQVRNELVRLLLEKRVAEMKEQKAKLLRDKAKVTYLRDPGPMPAPPDP